MSETKSQWTNADEQLPRDVQPCWVVDRANRADVALAIYYNNQKGFVLCGDAADNFEGQITHWKALRWPGALPKKRIQAQKDRT